MGALENSRMRWVAAMPSISGIMISMRIRWISFLLDKLHRLTSGIGLKQTVVAHGQINFQSIYNVWLVITNQNVVHVFFTSPPLHYIPGKFKMKEAAFLRIL